MKNLNKKLLAVLLGFVLVFTNVSNLQQANAQERNYIGTPEGTRASEAANKIINDSWDLLSDNEVINKLIEEGFEDDLAIWAVKQTNFGYKNIGAHLEEAKKHSETLIYKTSDKFSINFTVMDDYDFSDFKWYISNPDIAELGDGGAGPGDSEGTFETGRELIIKKPGKLVVALVHKDYGAPFYAEFIELVNEKDYEQAVKEKVKSYIQERIDKDPKDEDWSPVTRESIKGYLVRYLKYDEKIVDEAANSSEFDWKELALVYANDLAGPDHYMDYTNIEYNIKRNGFTKEEIAYALKNLEYDFDKIAEVKIGEYLDHGYSEALLIETFAKDYKMPEVKTKKYLKSLDINWNEVALKFASDIAIKHHYSQSLLIETLEKRLFLPEEIQYTLENIDIDWDENAVGAAEAIIKNNSYNHYSITGLIEELTNYGYTSKRAKAAVEKLNYNPKKVDLIEDYSKVDHKVKVDEYKTLYFSLDGYDKDEVRWYSTSHAIAYIADVMLSDDFEDFVPFNIEKLEVNGRKPGFVTIAVLDKNKKVIDQQTVEIIAKTSDETDDKEESNKPKEPIVIKNDKITLETAGATNIPSTAKLSFKDVSKEISKDKMEKFKENVDKTLLNNEIINLFDISLLVDGKELQPNGDVKVTIPLNDEMKMYKDLKVVYISDEGKVEEIEAEVKDGKISFITDHFSYYAVVGKNVNADNSEANNKEEATPDIPNTGLTTGFAIYSSTVMSSLGGLYVLTRKKRK